jgi:DUF1365 family protein
MTLLGGTAPGALYDVRVMHRRRVAPFYRFVYDLFYLLVDIDRLPELHRTRKLFSLNRFNLVSLKERDYGDGSGAPGAIRRWAEGLLAARGISLEGGRIQVLTLPRILGFAFNPISLYYCEHADGSLRAVIGEVRNTFGERHSYVLGKAGEPLRWDTPQDKDKIFHVSPFFQLEGRYRFHVSEPGESVRVHISETRDGAPLFDATLAGERRALTDGALLGHVLSMPWVTLKVVYAIHWEALKIWLRGAKYVSKPPPPLTEAS